MEIPSSSMTHATNTSPWSSIFCSARARMASNAETQPALSSAAPRPIMRSPSITGFRARSGQFANPTVSAWALIHKVGPSPLPRSRTNKLGRPLATSSKVTSRSVSASQAARNSAWFRSPAPDSISQGVTDSIFTRSERRLITSSGENFISFPSCLENGKQQIGHQLTLASDHLRYTVQVYQVTDTWGNEV